MPENPEKQGNIGKFSVTYLTHNALFFLYYGNIFSFFYESRHHPPAFINVYII